MDDNREQPKKQKRMLLQLDIKSAMKTINNDQQSNLLKSIDQSCELKGLPECFNENDEKLNYDNFHQFKVFCDVAMKKNNRNYQEDRFSAVCPIDISTEYDAFFAVFDGHKTFKIAEILKNNLHEYIFQNPNYKNDIITSIKQSFQKIDSEIIHYQNEKKLNQGGSTALCALIQEQNLYVINCGDSSCIYITNDYQAKMMNQLHKASEKSEQDLLKEKGAVILGKHDRINGELAVSRSIGDSSYKQYITCEPEITKQEITENCRYLLLATDGFWDTISYNVELPKILKIWDQQNNESDVQNLSSYLIEIASNKETNFKKDNMTLLAIDLGFFYKQNVLKEFEQQVGEQRSFVIASKPEFNQDVQQFSFFENFKDKKQNKARSATLIDSTPLSQILISQKQGSLSVCIKENNSIKKDKVDPQYIINEIDNTLNLFAQNKQKQKVNYESNEQDKIGEEAKEDDYLSQDDYFSTCQRYKSFQIDKFDFFEITN